ncbi:hypothetical protein ANCDUO_07106 [Ancylostoma duodenale]|uniref:Uncharacterized protein n=1 Tax=Ancylostoma duodenale TaxID=51022 RepID=A0A0C2DJC6_9BILA|nr:hypothetical protein ANCDUO_07106 [Ancylostoma duodenale]
MWFVLVALAVWATSTAADFNCSQAPGKGKPYFENTLKSVTDIPPRNAFQISFASRVAKSLKGNHNDPLLFLGPNRLSRRCIRI